jgi:hypothetical protein
MRARWHLLCPRNLLGCAALLLLAGCVTEPKGDATRPLPAQVVGLKGEVRWASDIGVPWEEAKLWTPLPEGAMIETGPNSRVLVWFGQIPGSLRHPRMVRYEFHTNAAVRLWENSHLRLDRLVQKRISGSKNTSLGLRLNLSTGHMFGRAPKFDQGSTYEVQFGSCVAQLTNGLSLYDVSADGLIRVEGGPASVRWPGSPGTLIVKGGQQLDARTNVLQRITLDTSHWWHYLP